MASLIKLTTVNLILKAKVSAYLFVPTIHFPMILSMSLLPASVMDFRILLFGSLTLLFLLFSFALAADPLREGDNDSGLVGFEDLAGNCKSL